MSTERTRTIRSKLLIAFPGIAVGSCLVIAVTTSLHLRDTTLRQTERSLLSLAEVTAHTVSAGLDFGLPGSVQTTLAGLFKIPDIRYVAVRKSNGEVFVSMGDDPGIPLCPMHGGASAIHQHPGFLVATTPVRDMADLAIGELTILYSMERTNRALMSSILWRLLILLGTAVASVIASLSIARHLTTPLTRLTEAAQRLAAGRFDEPVRVASNDEIGILARTFNTMSRALLDSRRQVERANQELEGRIRERTEELRQKNIALELQTERALEASRLKSAFLASVSHELRTPLNAILALSELMKDGLAGELTEEQQSHVTMIHSSGSGLLRLINDVLDLSKIEAGKMELTPKPCNVLEELRRAVTQMEPLASRKGLDLRVAIPAGPIVSLDGDRVRQILVNLLGNAIKFTERGYVEVAAEVKEGPDLLEMSVRDTGIGIDKQDLQAIFQEFRQVDGTPSRKFGGTGLGLTISRRLVEMMGGQIFVESTLGEGSCFRVEIPLAQGRSRQDGDLADRAMAA
ncbi:MAG: HAMP domain-containing protein [Ignavibacteriaceae bacterium]|nr:HAMP domain-containing protein [Ignavibacteriaceae bacterium]